MNSGIDELSFHQQQDQFLQDFLTEEKTSPEVNKNVIILTKNVWPRAKPSTGLITERT